MGLPSISLGRLPTFRRGVHPPDAKDATAHRPIEPMPFVSEYVLPLGQSIGAPASPLLDPGARVRRGQMIAGASGFVSVALHSPVTGVITAIEPRPRAGGAMVPSMVIEADPFSDQRLPLAEPHDLDDLDREDIVSAVQKAGIVGLGGAAFPAHVKLAIPPEKKVRTVIVNGCECEPYLTCDHRIMLERPSEVIRGTEILMRISGAEEAFIGIEANKPDAVEVLSEVASEGIKVVPTTVKYPQGGERMLIAAIVGPEVGAGSLPLDAEVLVNNVGTIVAVADVFDRGRPLIDRVFTVTGPAIAEPNNLLVPIGTKLSDIIEHCGGLLPSAKQVVLGGPMMGMSLSRLDVPLIKGASGLLCLDRPAPAAEEAMPCIRCSRCVTACPMGLNPSRIARVAKAAKLDDLPNVDIGSCFECASCSFVCPSGIPLVQWIRIGKAMLADRKEKE